MYLLVCWSECQLRLLKQFSISYHWFWRSRLEERSSWLDLSDSWICKFSVAFFSDFLALGFKLNSRNWVLLKSVINLRPRHCFCSMFCWPRSICVLFCFSYVPIFDRNISCSRFCTDLFPFLLMAWNTEGKESTGLIKLRFRDIIPIGRDLQETNRNLDEITDYILTLQNETGIRPLWATCNLFSHPRCF